MTPRCTRRTSGKNNTTPITVVPVIYTVQYKASPVKTSRKGKILYIPSPVKLPAQARNTKPLTNSDAGNSLTRKRKNDMFDKKNVVPEKVAKRVGSAKDFSDKGKRKMQNVSVTNEDKCRNEQPKRKRGTPCCPCTGTLLQKRRHLLKGRYTGMDDSQSESGSDISYNPCGDTDEDSNTSDIEPDSDKSDADNDGQQSTSQPDTEWVFPRVTNKDFKFTECCNANLTTLGEDASPSSFYSFFCDYEIVSLMVCETNR